MLFIVDDAGRITGTHGGGGVPLSAPAADESGNFYVVGAALQSFDAMGAPRWSVPLGDGQSGAGGEIAIGKTLGVVTTDDGYISVFSLTDGDIVSRKDVGLNANAPLLINGAVGRFVFLSSPSGGVQVVYDTVADSVSPYVAPATGDPFYFAMSGPGLGVIALRVTGFSGGMAYLEVVSHEPCGAVRWMSDPALTWPSLVLEDSAIVFGRAEDETDRATLVLDRDGALLVAPQTVGLPAAYGADGTLYAIRCGTQTELIALTRNLEELWRLDLETTCPSSPPVISRNGVMFLARHVGIAASIMGVQTRSPGTASTAWSVRDIRDSRASRWLTE